MEFVIDGQKYNLQMAWWEQDEATIAERQEQERTTIKKKFFLEALERAGGRIIAAAQHADISRATYYVWAKEDPAFKEKVDEVLNRRGAVIRDYLTTKAMEGNVRALIYLDQRYNKDQDAGPKHLHIHHHKESVQEQKPKHTLEDIIYESAVRTMLLVKQGLLPHVHDTADQLRILETLSPEKRAALEEEVKKTLRTGS